MDVSGKYNTLTKNVTLNDLYFSVYDFIDENEEIMLPSTFRRQIVSENNSDRVGVLIKKDKKNNYISNLL